MNIRNGKVRPTQAWNWISSNVVHQSVTVMIADACPTCVNSNSIDLSMLAFQQIASLPEGMVPSKLILP